MATPVQRAAWVTAGVPGMLSVVIPARNERENLRSTIAGLVTALNGASITHEIIVVDDHSDDGTAVELVSSNVTFRRYAMFLMRTRVASGLPFAPAWIRFAATAWLS
jgi:cellulose synthase/poly-beta-1,6-N-acetylglucosamine synthase-like glycosyltransferase